MNAEKERDPYNTAVAAELSRLVDQTETGMMRLSRLTGIPRGTLHRYLNGTRDIRIAELRKIVTAVDGDIADVLREAERSL